MASGRSLGGGRILGSGRSLSPAVHPPPSSSPAASPHKRNSSVLSPAPSESSLGSQSPANTSTSTIDAQDLGSRVSLGREDHVAGGGGQAAAAAAAGSRLVCPICNEEMVTLLQLNRHLDDVHKNLEEVEQDEVKNWFKTQMVKAKRFQPLAVLNQKFKGLDVFESNDTSSPTPPLPSHAPIAAPSGPLYPEPAKVVDPDEVVSRTHWQRPSGYDMCSDPTCGLRLGAANGQVNCRHCGKLFCDEHTMYQMKLSRSAQHEPVRGFWCRVCETCYKSKDGYNDHNGAITDHTKEFVKLRRQTVDKQYLEINRLEKRLSKLTHLLADPPTDITANSAGFWPLSSGTKAQLRALEQSVINWEDDASVAKCPFCQQEFTNYTFRRHHCRVCGRVVCGDPATQCSIEVGLNVAKGEKPPAAQGSLAVDVRMCKDCRHTLFSRSDYQRELEHKPPDQRSYENMAQFERGIRLLMPKFQRLLVALQDPENPPTPGQLAEATRVRKRLMDTFTQFDAAARRIRDMPTESPTQKRLQKAVYAQASRFLHLHMLPLKSLPKVLKHATPAGASKSPPHAAGKPGGALAAIRFNSLSGDDVSSQVSSSSAVESLEAEEKELRERLIVLEEQRFFVQEMVADANRRRKFDEVASLAKNVEDLSKEIDGVNGLLGEVGRGIKEAYEGGIG
ncbi:hypothetical protein NA57DRAFT_33796 [Rhizodiscina lignyota]|uniref:FYVE-type domain-containing protein n=1 Tax=Rhizodiscina lignyota TaxID=1504668 RepID=A0A9P4IHV5_9PEZI|nr:hypothetical protein NA57DRAFT_33796 [Rhizodiscina lignyota]